MTTRKGPAPLPNERKKRTGTFRPSRAAGGADVVALEGARPDLEAPEYLGDEGQAVWSMLMSDVPWLASSDLLAVSLVAELFDRRAVLLAEWESFPRPTLTTPNGYVYANPVLGLLRAVEKDIGGHLSALGLTPSDRTRIGLGEVRRQSKLDELRERHNRGQAG